MQALVQAPALLTPWQGAQVLQAVVEARVKAWSTSVDIRVKSAVPGRADRRL